MNNRKNDIIFKLCCAGLCLALAYVLPFFTGQIKAVGKMLCPMHIPVLLCGIICGWQYGLAVGIAAPFLRSVTVGMPVLFPNAVAMAVELAAYGVIVGVMYRLLPKKVPNIYVSLLTAMIGGRIIWGTVSYFLYMANGTSFTMDKFIAGAVTEALPGIAIQIVFIPLIVIALKRAKIVK